MAYILLYAPFFISNYFLHNISTLLVYVLYIFGFEVGPLFNKILSKNILKTYKLSSVLLIFSSILIWIPNIYIYLLVTLLLSIYLGIVNMLLNNTHIKVGMTNGYQGIFQKYKLSNLGNQLFYFIFILLITLSLKFNHANIYNFFSGTLDSSKLLIVFLITNVILVLPTIMIVIKDRNA